MNAFDYFFENTKDLNKNFILGPKEQIAYSELHTNSLFLSEYLKGQTAEEEKILIISHNNVFFLTAYLAILKSGRICVPVNPDIEAENLKYIIKECKAQYIFIQDRLKDRFSLSENNIISEIHLSGSEILITKGVSKVFDSNKCAEIIFTSGSTGVPKGVMISHLNLISNCNSIIDYLKLSEADIMEVVLPFYYCYGLSLLHTHLRVGGSIVLNNTFIFLGSVFTDLKKYKCTGFAGVPSHFQILLRKSDSFKKTVFPHLRYVTQAGGKLHKVFIQEFIDSHPGIDFFVMYGQTEATARLSYLPLRHLKEKLGSIGKGIPDVELHVVDDLGQQIKPGEDGEIIARGDNIMLGYLNDPVSTAETIQNKWLQTGDLGTIDEDGFIFLKSRSKEIIKVGGKRISPKEIEETIVSIPEVIDCTVFGVPDDLLGEAIKTRIVVDKSHFHQITPETIKNYCAERLSSFKVPHIIEIEDRVNISSTGKKIKSEIK